MPDDSPLPTLASLVSTFGTFLTVAIHTILFERNIYPAASFLTARKYNFPVRQSRHPRVCQWITDAVAAVEAEMLRGTVARVAVVIFAVEGGSRPLERFVFDVERFPVVPPGETATPLLREAAKARDGLGQAAKAAKDGTSTTGLDQAAQDGKGAVAIDKPARPAAKKLPEVDVDEQLRGVMSKLSTCGSRLGRIPAGCSFTVSVELKDEAEAPLGHPQPWIPSAPALQTTVTARSNEAYGGDRRTATHRGEELTGANLVPVRSVSAGEMVFEAWVEEGRAKSELNSQERFTEQSSSLAS